MYKKASPAERLNSANLLLLTHVFRANYGFQVSWDLETGREESEKLAKKADQIKDGEGFVVSKWINLRNHGGLAIPAEKFAEDLVQMNIVFKVKESRDFATVLHSPV